MSWANIRSGLQTKLAALSGINNVLDYVVWTDDWAVIYEKFEEGGRLDTWMISLNNTPQHVVSSQDKNITWVANIVGYYSIKTSDESSKDFEDNIETILNALALGKNVLGLPGVTNTAPLLTTVANTLFNKSPAHTAVIQITFNEYVDQALQCGDG